MKNPKLYKVEIGLIQKNGEEIVNWSSKNIVADCADAAIRRARLSKSQFAEAVELIAQIDVL